MYIIMMISSKT